MFSSFEQCLCSVYLAILNQHYLTWSLWWVFNASNVTYTLELIYTENILKSGQCYFCRINCFPSCWKDSREGLALTKKVWAFHNTCKAGRLFQKHFMQKLTSQLNVRWSQNVQIFILKHFRLKMEISFILNQWHYDIPTPLQLVLLVLLPSGIT